MRNLLSRWGMVLALGGVLLGLGSGGAFADEGWRHGRGPDGWGPPGHRHHEREWRRYYAPPPVIYAPPPRQYYAPPPLVVAPPPAILAPQPGVTLIVPLTIR